VGLGLDLRSALRPIDEPRAQQRPRLRSASVTRRGLNDANQRQQVLHYGLAHKS
jgi:hypothetical protein